MKTVLTMMLIVFVCSCTTTGKPASKVPAARPSGDALWPTCPDRNDCSDPNGTQSRGLTDGERAAPIRAVTLMSGETITLR